MSKFIEVLKAGERLEDPVNWKKVQLYSTAVITLLDSIAQFIDIGLTPGQINAIALLSGIVVFFINSYLTLATTDKIGL